MTDIERKMFLDQINKITAERNEYARKYEAAKKSQEEYDELVAEYKEKEKRLDSLIEYTEILISELQSI